MYRNERDPVPLRIHRILGGERVGDGGYDVCSTNDDHKFPTTGVTFYMAGAIGVSASYRHSSRFAARSVASALQIAMVVARHKQGDALVSSASNCAEFGVDIP